MNELKQCINSSLNTLNKFKVIPNIELVNVHYHLTEINTLLCETSLSIKNLISVNSHITCINHQVSTGFDKYPEMFTDIMINNFDNIDKSFQQFISTLDFKVTL